MISVVNKNSVSNVQMDPMSYSKTSLFPPGVWEQFLNKQVNIVVNKS